MCAFPEREGMPKTCAYVHPVRGMGIRQHQVVFWLPVRHVMGTSRLPGQPVSGPSSTGYSGASATDFHRLPLPALERNESQKETSRKKNV